MTVSREQLERLMAPFPPEAIERTSGAETHRGYDTAGIKYQYVVNRLNEVLGIGRWRYDAAIEVECSQTRNGRERFTAVCDLRMFIGEYVEGRFVTCAEASGTGGHESTSKADAKKGALTNAIKKVAAMFGVGWQTYAGAFDDDNRFEDPAKKPERKPRARASEPKGAGAGGWPQAREQWINVLGRQLFADCVGCDVELVDDYMPPDDPKERAAIRAVLERARRDLDEMTAAPSAAEIQEEARRAR